MFSWFKRKQSNEDTALPTTLDTKEEIPAPKAETPKPEKPAISYYRLGITDNNRVSLQMGYSEITMNRKGVQNLIDQLAVFRDHLTEDENNDEQDSED